MSTTAENELRKVYKDHNLHVLFGATLMAAIAGTLGLTPSAEAPVSCQGYGLLSAGRGASTSFDLFNRAAARSVTSVR
jgi:hypothetical protein